MSTPGAAILSTLLTAVVGMLVMESYQTTPWLADKLMQWSVRLRYADNPQRAKVRGEELSSLLEELPTLFKFPTAGWFFIRALAYRFGRGLGTAPTDRILRLRARRILRARRHWAVLSGVLLQTLGILIGAFFLSRLLFRLVGVAESLWLVQSLLWYIAIFALIRLSWTMLQWWAESLIVTDKEIMIISGIILSEISMMMLLTEVTNVSFMQPAGGKLLNYGTLRVTLQAEPGAAERVQEIKYLCRPDIIKWIFDESLYHDSSPMDEIAKMVPKEDGA